MTKGPLPLAAGLPPAANCRFGAGCADGDGLQPHETERPLPPEIAAKVQDHPCYSEQAHHHFARMHVAVAPACNIQCHYCNRKFDCAAESRPGVVSERLTPEQALRKVMAVAQAVPALSVVGIAGPGDALASAEATFRTCALVAQALPDVKLCLSTNGLALPDHVDAIVAAGVQHVTVTVNMIDPEVGERIYPWISLRGKRYRGREASRILSERQLEGIARLAEKGVLCKVNSVLIPGVNDGHLPEVNRTVRALGAFLHNVMPLLSAPEYGTHYGLCGQRGPTAAELEAVQEACGGARIMRHCRQCRADAVGLLGEDRGPEFALARLSVQPAADAAPDRAAHRTVVDRRREQSAEARARALRGVAGVGVGALRIRVAVATRGEGQVNEHFGHAREFQVYEASGEGARLVGVRRVAQYCVGGDGEEDALEGVVRALSDCVAVLASRIGRCPQERLREAGIEPVQEHAFAWIEEAVLAHLGSYADRVARGEVAHAPRPEPVPLTPEPREVREAS